MGDSGRIYVARELVDVYREKAVPAASVLTPNQFEAELLAETGPIRSLADAAKTCDALHARGPHTGESTEGALRHSRGGRRVQLVSEAREGRICGEDNDVPTMHVDSATDRRRIPSTMRVQL